MLCPPSPASCNIEGLGSQERGLRAQVIPQVQAGFPATEAALAPSPNIWQSLRAKRVGQATGASTGDAQAPLLPASHHPRVEEREPKTTLPVERAPESSENRPGQQRKRTARFLLLTRPRQPTRKVPYCSCPALTPRTLLSAKTERPIQYHQVTRGPTSPAFLCLLETTKDRNRQRLGSETFWSPLDLWKGQSCQALPAGCCPGGHGPGVWGLPAATCSMGVYQLCAPT